MNEDIEGLVKPEHIWVREVQLCYTSSGGGGYKGKMCPTQPLDNPEKAAEALRRFVDLQPQELFAVMALDARMSPIGYYQVAKGSMTCSLVHPREVFRTAIFLGANAIIILHNHPSGRATPSAEDRTITTRLCQAGDTVGIRVMDHLIIAGEECYSFVENEEMPKSDHENRTREDH